MAKNEHDPFGDSEDGGGADFSLGDHVPRKKPRKRTNAKAPAARTSMSPPKKIAVGLAAVVAIVGIHSVVRIAMRPSIIVPPPPAPMLAPVAVEPVARPEATTIEFVDLPPRAVIRVNGRVSALHPFEVAPGAEYFIEISAPGYLSKELRYTPARSTKLEARLMPLGKQGPRRTVLSN